MSGATTPQLVSRSDCELGEGPVWSARDRSVWFVDIKGHRIHRFEPATGAARSWRAPDQVGFIAPLADGRWIAGVKGGLHRFDPTSGLFNLVALVEDATPGNRLNDGFVDPAGRLWFGSMDDGEAALTGALYRLDRRGLERMDAAEIARRKAEPPPSIPPSQTPWEELYRERIGQLADGAVFEGAVKYRGIAARTPRHNH